MKPVGLICTSMLLVSLFFGCSHNVTSRLPKVFETEYLNSQTSVQPVDLGSGGKCPGARALYLKNTESRTDTYTVYSMAGTSNTIIPSEYISIVVDYMEEKLRESNVPVDTTSGKKIEVAMEEVRAEGAWTFGCDVRLKVTIPEIGYTQIYSGNEGSAIIMNAIGYATNLAIDDFLRDPVIRNYIQCLEE